MVFARGRSTWATAASLFNAHVAPFEIKSMKGIDGSLGVFSQDKLDEAETAGVARVRITHNGRILNFSIFAKEFSEVFFLDLLGEASDEKVGAFVVVIATRLGRLSIA
jgi:hypothetical protein